MTDLMKPPRVPCATCPYLKKTPPGIWHQDEYEKLIPYDADTWDQPPQLFMCHQKDGCLCGGWLMTHDREHLLALRLHGSLVDKAIWEYNPDVEVFESGKAAAEHGMSGIDEPNEEARIKIDALIRRRGEISE